MIRTTCLSEKGIIEADADGQEPPVIPSIIEVPQWLARLEPKLAAFDGDELAEGKEQSETLRPNPDDPPPKQQELF